jgi:hypothetical protein
MRAGPTVLIVARAQCAPVNPAHKWATGSPEPRRCGTGCRQTPLPAHDDGLIALAKDPRRGAQAHCEFPRSIPEFHRELRGIATTVDWNRSTAQPSIGCWSFQLNPTSQRGGRASVLNSGSGRLLASDRPVRLFTENSTVFCASE